MPVALRPRHSPYSLVPVDKALGTVLQSVSVLPPIETASLQGTVCVCLICMCLCCRKVKKLEIRDKFLLMMI